MAPARLTRLDSTHLLPASIRNHFARHRKKSIRYTLEFDCDTVHTAIHVDKPCHHHHLLRNNIIQYSTVQIFS
jgi:hypothetical protein